MYVFVSTSPASAPSQAKLSLIIRHTPAPQGRKAKKEAGSEQDVCSLDSMAFASFTSFIHPLIPTPYSQTACEDTDGVLIVRRMVMPGERLGKMESTTNHTTATHRQKEDTHTHTHIYIYIYTHAAQQKDRGE